MASMKTYDPFIISRVKQYLEDNVDKTYVDVTEMTKTLMERYREYNRRKMAPFRNLVEHAYKTVLHSYGLDSNPGSEIDDMGSDLEVMDDSVNANHCNDALTSMYMNKSNNPVTSTNDGVLIDISSDESDSDEANNLKLSKGNNKINEVTVTRINSKSTANGTTTTTTAATATTMSNQIHIPTLNDQFNNLKKPKHHSQQNITLKKRRLESPPEQLNNQAGASTDSQPPPAMKPKKFKKEVFAKKSLLTFADVGGMDKVLKELCELILHIKHPEIYRHIGLPPPRGFLLHGPPGSGKTLLAQAIAGQLDVLMVEVPATELVAGVSGESEERIREIFEQAACFAPCVLFIDEIDAISSNRMNASKDMERRVVAQLLSSLDNLSKLKFGDQVLVIGATNRADALDPALRRVGRFDHEICLGIPDRPARSEILQIISKNLKLERPFDFDEMAQLTPGYVGADLLALATRAASTAIKRVISDKEQNDWNVRKDKELQKVDNAIVNIDDDSILMDVDQDVTEKIVIENTPEQEEKVKENGADNHTETTSTETTESVEKPAEATIEETKDIKEVEENPQIMEVKDDETLVEAILKQPNLKLQLSLDNMVKWLRDDATPLNEQELERLSIMRVDFLDALKFVQPSAKREGFITVPDVTWDDIGSLQDIRNELKLAILAPVKFPAKLKMLGLQSPSGVLLCGPPGCGKTLLAKAVANEAGINFISVKGPELLNMYVGESERAVRQCFQRARNSAPCVIFFDEFDSLCPKRNDSGDNGASMRVVNQLLTEMDGVEERKGVFLMAATNRPDIVDPAVLRPGRLDKILYVGLPDLSDRVDILRALTKNGTKPQLAEDVKIQEIADITGGYTGADLAGLVRQASLQTLKESIMSADVEEDAKEGDMTILEVHRSHFMDAFKKLKPSVNEQEIKHYEKLKVKYGQPKEES
ncbi:unnamed protein product [Diamesa hyperborea]